MELIECFYNRVIIRYFIEKDNIGSNFFDSLGF